MHTDSVAPPRASREATTRRWPPHAGAFALLTQQLQQPVCLKNESLELVAVNQAYARLVGLNPEELVGRTEHAALGERFGQATEASDRQALSGGQPVHCELVFPPQGGSERAYRAVKVPLTDEGGTLTLACAVTVDASVSDPSASGGELELIAHEQTRALRAAQGQLLRKERIAVLGQLAAGLAHQIRNPLAAISNGLSLVRRQAKDLNKPVMHEAIRIAMDEIWEANRIVGDLLDFARIGPPEPQAVELVEIVRAAIASERLPENILVEILAAQDVPPLDVHADERQVRTALGNLIRNAREAMPDGGKLSFESQAGEHFVELFVQDSGGGVAEAHRDLLFEPLVSGKPLGIGLGLPTARALIENQDGSLDFVENLDGGARFVLRLPRTTDQPLSRETLSERAS